MLRDAGVRGKLFAVLAIPMLLLVVATGWLVGGQVQSARQAGKIEAVTDVAIQLNRVVHSLQLERSDTLVFLQEPTAAGRATMASQRKDTDAALVVLREKVVDSPIPAMSESIQSAAARTEAAHSELIGARKSIDAGRFFATETDVFYGKIIATDLQLPGVISASASPQLAQRLQAQEALSTTIESASHERDLVQLAYLSGTINEAEFGQASALVAQQRQSLQDFQRSAPVVLFADLDSKLADSDVTALDTSRRHLTDLLSGRARDRSGSVTWLKAANPRITSMVTTESELVTDIANVAASLQSAEQLKAGIFGAGAIFGLVLAVLLAAVLAQRITLPLRRLTLAAGEIGEELPRMVERMQRPGEGPGVVVEPIPVESDDEIGRLAAAFNTVNEVTLRVAQEQAALRASIAEMFVNVARRNQVLLGRQLAQLDKMEAREEDADLLKNLFRLDHLATRMRRNAESLLVLAGIDSTRRLRQSMPLSDVIGAAISEIEAYERIDDPSMADDPSVSGRHALSIAHLFAELLENATVFSNPGTRVVVAAAMTGHGVDVTITDYGLGMSDDEISRANESIAHPPLAEIAVSQRLGLFVVGRIAARLGATATLRQGRSAGTVVTVGLPLDVFEGLQVEEPADEPVVGQSSTATPDALAAPLDEPSQDASLTEPGVLVGAVPLAGSVPAALVEAMPTPAVARFNPSDVALSRLPQVDVAALMADAVADRRTHAIAAPFTPDTTGRRLLPRRARSDEPAGAADATSTSEASANDLLDTGLPVADVPVGAGPVGEGLVSEPVVVQPVVDEAVLGVVADADESSLTEGEPFVGELPLSEVEPSVDDLPTAEQSEAAPLEGAASACRRGSFFAWRRHESPAETVEPEQPEAFVVDPAASMDQPGELAGSLVDQEPPSESPGESARTELPFGAELDHPAPADAAVPGGPADEPVEPATSGSPTRRRGLFGRRQWTADEPLVVDEASGKPAIAAVAETVPEPAVEGELFTPTFEPLPADDQLFTPIFEPVAAEALVARVADIEASEPVAELPVAELPVAEQPVAELPVAEEPVVEEPVAEHVARRRGLFGRRQPVVQQVVEPEQVEPEQVEPERVALEPVAVPESGTETVLEPIDVEAMLAPVVEIALPGPFSWPVSDRPLANEPVAAEPITAGPITAGPITTEPLATVVEEAIAVPTVEHPAEGAAVDEHSVEVVDEPVRRRGLFGRRHRHGETMADDAAARSLRADTAADAAALALPAPADDFPRDSFAAHLPEPVAEPAPAPAAPLYLASAIDILPAKPMGRRGKHGKPAPAPVAPPAPATSYAAPATSYAAPATTYAAPATTYAAPLASEPVSPPPAFAPPVEQQPVQPAPAAAPSMPQREPVSPAPSAPPRQASAPEPATASQPPATARMTELDQLALNAELQKSALSELRGLYEPSLNQVAAPVADTNAGLIRRQRRAVEAVAETEVSDLPSRTRDPSEVRGMLSGFRAGVERGRSAPQSATQAPTYGDVVIDHEAATDSANGAAEATDDSTD